MLLSTPDFWDTALLIFTGKPLHYTFQLNHPTNLNQFIAVYDIMNYILWRFLLSTALCRLILLIEISGLRPESTYYQEQKWERDHAAKLEARSEIPSPPPMSPRQTVQFSPIESEHLKTRSPALQEQPVLN